MLIMTRLLLVAATGALALGISVPAANAESQRDETAITCNNSTSGTNWQITASSIEAIIAELTPTASRSRQLPPLRIAARNS